MKRLILCYLGVFFVGLALSGQAAEKLNFATAIKVYPPYALPALAAEEKGIWKQNGLEATWAPFKSSIDMANAFAAGYVNVGGWSIVVTFQAVSRGVPVVAVAQMDSRDSYVLWVAAQGRIREPKELKGGKVAVGRIGSLAYAYALVALRSLGLEKDVKLVGAGGVTASAAMLRAGSLEGALGSYYALMELKAKGEIRELIKIEDYLPKEWVSTVIAARREFARSNPDGVRRVVRAFFQAIDFVMKNKEWSVNKMKAELGYSEEAARTAFDILSYTKDGAFSIKGLENVRKFVAEHGIVPVEKVPPLDQIYLPGLTP